MRMLLLTILGCLILSSGAASQAADAPPSKIKVLLITGDDVAPAHNWREISVATRDILVSSGKFDVKVCEDAGVLESAASLGRYDLVFLAM